MDSFKFHDVRAEKANAILRYRRIQRIATLFRYVEIFAFLIIVSRCFTQFAFSFNISAEYFRGISSTLISPKFVFVLGNAIVVVLLLLSGQFSSKSGGKTDFYDEYVEECRRNHHQVWIKEEKVESDGNKHTVCVTEKIKMCRSHSGNLERTHGHERRRKLRRSLTERCRKSTVESGRKVATSAAASGGDSTYAEDEMSSEEFRRTVEAFIARQQRSLREEDDFSAAVVSFET